MGIDFKGWLNSAKGTISSEVKKLQNKDMLEAIVAGCAIVAFSDGNVSAAEKQKMAGYISRSEELKVFNMNQVIERFNHYVGGFEFDHVIGKNEALKAIGKFSSKPEVARVIVSVCCAIGGADGDFDQHEKNAVREICSVLKLAPGDFGL